MADDAIPFMQVHRFNHCVAIYVGGKTQYLTPQEALKLADALCKTADDVDEHDASKSRVGTFELELEFDGN